MESMKPSAITSIKITSVNLVEYTVPFKRPFVTSRYSNTNGFGIFIIVEGRTSEGVIVGVGECSPRKLVTGESLEAAWAAAKVLREYLLQVVKEIPVGTDGVKILSRIGESFSLLISEQGLKVSHGTDFPSVRLGYEIALLDLVGKSKNLPIYKLLGQRVKTIAPNAFTFSAPRAEKDGASLEFKIKKARRFGCARIKGTGDATKDLGLLENMAFKFSRSEGKTDIWIDLNERCSISPEDFVTKLFEHLRSIPYYGSIIIEQPVPRNEIEALASVSRYCRQRSGRARVLIMADESVNTVRDLKQNPALLEVDAINIKPQKAGSLLECQTLANFFHEKRPGGGVYIGGVIGSTDITSWATYHLSRAIPNLRYSTLAPKHNFQVQVASVPIRARKNGALKAPLFSGLGTGLDPAALSNVYRKAYPVGRINLGSSVFAPRSDARTRKPVSSKEKIKKGFFKIKPLIRSIGKKVWILSGCDLSKNRNGDGQKTTGKTQYGASDWLSSMIKARGRGESAVADLRASAGKDDRQLSYQTWHEATTGFIQTLGVPNQYDEPWLSWFGKKELDSHLMEREALGLGLTTIRYTPLMFLAEDRDGRRMGFNWSSGISPSIAVRTLTGKKHLTKLLLAEVSVPVPKGEEFSTSDFDLAAAFLAAMDGPVVVKPLVGTGGVGVTTGVSTREHLEFAWNQITAGKKASGRNDGFIVVEKHIPGDDFRFFVVGDDVVSVIKRAPAHVIGNGQDRVRQLVATKNKMRASNPHLGPRKLKINRAAEFQLLRQGISPDGVPSRDQVVFLSTAGNLSQGADSVSVLHETHPSLLEAAVRAVKAFPGLQQAGVDFLLDDHRAALHVQEAGVCEVNTSPAITSHHFPAYGEPYNLAKSLVQINAEMQGVNVSSLDGGSVTLDVICNGKCSDVELARVEKYSSELGLKVNIVRADSTGLRFTVDGEFGKASALSSSLIAGQKSANWGSVKIMPFG